MTSHYGFEHRARLERRETHAPRRQREPETVFVRPVSGKKSSYHERTRTRQEPVYDEPIREQHSPRSRAYHYDFVLETEDEIHVHARRETHEEKRRRRDVEALARESSRSQVATGIAKKKPPVPPKKFRGEIFEYPRVTNDLDPPLKSKELKVPKILASGEVLSVGQDSRGRTFVMRKSTRTGKKPPKMNPLPTPPSSISSE